MMLYLFALIFGFSGSWLVIKLGFVLGLVDIPNERSSHFKSIPKGGGIGILAVFIIACKYLNLFWAWWIPAVFISLISLFGDRIDISPKIRLILQIVFSGISLYFCDFSKYFSSISFGNTTSSILNYVLLGLLVIFVVGSTNFYNFMDGINGIASVTGIIAFSFLAIVCYQNEIYESIRIISVCVSLACLGFLPTNFPSASVFMGDVGSILLGFVFSCFIVIVAQDFIELIRYAGFILPFYFDELETMVERLISKDSLTKPHRKHLYQVFANEGGIAHWKVALGYGGAQLMVCLLVLFLFKNLGLQYLLGFYSILFLLYAKFSTSMKKKIRDFSNIA